MQTELDNEYAEAIYALASEEKMEESYYHDLLDLCKMFQECPEAPKFLDSPSVPQSQRSAMIDEIFGEQYRPFFVSFIHLLSDTRKVFLLNDIAREYEKIYFKDKNICRARVISSVELTDEEKERLREKLEHKSGHKVIPEYITDASLLGGVIVEMNGSRMDGSLRTRLATLKGVLEQ